MCALQRLACARLELEFGIADRIEDLVAPLEELAGERGVAELLIDHLVCRGHAHAHECMPDALGDIERQIGGRAAPGVLAHALRVQQRSVHVKDDRIHMRPSVRGFPHTMVPAICSRTMLGDKPCEER